MKVIRIIWIAVLVLLLPLMAAGYFTYSQQQKEKAKINRHIKELEIKNEKLKEKDTVFEKLKKKGK